MEKKIKLKRTREGKRSTKNKKQKKIFFNFRVLVRPCMRPEVPSPTEKNFRTFLNTAFYYRSNTNLEAVQQNKVH